MTRGTTSILYLFEGAFSLWRRRLKGVYAGARERGWHVESVNADDEGVTSKAVLRFWRPDGVIVDGAALGRSGFSLADFKDIPIVYCDADEEIVTGEHYGVRHDSRAAVRLALDELISLRRESYGYVHYFTPQDWSDDRERLFSDTDIPVSLVAEKCGYGNERSLRYVFAKATGVSPIEWRRNGVGS